MLRTCKRKWDFYKIDLNALNLNKCLEQIELPISLHTCPSTSTLTSDISDYLGKPQNKFI